MATKKQKREAALARRAEFEAEVRADGLKAQAADRAKRKAEEERMWDDAHKVHLKRNRFHDKCPNCARVKAQQALDRLAKAANRAAKAASAAAESTDKAGKAIRNLLTEGEHKGDNTPIDLTRMEKVNA